MNGVIYSITMLVSKYNKEEAKAYWSAIRGFYRRTREFTLSELALKLCC
ncbi:hypothetical protein HGI79_00265 [Clostridium sp. DJ247]|nr:hypothetical protein [Clostridium sp. DJ247]